MKEKRKIAYIAGTVAFAALAVAGYYFVPVKDPEGVSRRNPTSMHAHQRDWPDTCHGPAARKQSPILLTTTHFSSANVLPVKTNLGQINADLIDVGYTFQIRTLDQEVN